MRTVLYTEDMEPITVLELTTQAVNYLKQNNCVRLAVYEPIKLSMLVPSIRPQLTSMRTVCIWQEPLHRNGRVSFILFTHDDENALLLKSAFLPGQVANVQHREREAFAKGFLAAFSQIG